MALAEYPKPELLVQLAKLQINRYKKQLAVLKSDPKRNPYKVTELGYLIIAWEEVLAENGIIAKIGQAAKWQIEEAVEDGELQLI